MNKKTAQQFTFLLIFMIVTACAKISSPSGGARDRTPPEVLESYPENGAVNFSDDNLSVEFDEYVVLDNINDKFMVSPPMVKKPRVYTRGKSVRVEYEDKLKDSTTYTFYFMDAIRDLNEGNIIPNFRIAFSTGSFIDSLSVTGNVYMSPNLDPPEAAAILLYRNLEDTAVIKQIPDYLSRVDATGYFRIDNVREGIYRMYALKDDDNSKNYNRVEEPFGFLDSVITVTPDKNYLPPEPDTLQTSLPRANVKKPAPAPVRITKTTASENKKKEEEALIPVKTGEHRVLMFPARKTARYLANSSRSKNYRLNFILSVPPDTMDFSFRLQDVPEDAYIMETSPFRDTITVWITDSTVYKQQQLSAIIRYPFTDTLEVHGYEEDTIKMIFMTPKTPRGGARKTMLALNNNISGGTLKPGQKIVFTSETPLRDPDTTLIRLYEQIEKKRLRIPYQFIRDSLKLGRLVLNAKLNEGKKYLFIADSTSFSNIYNEHIDSTAISFSVRESSSYSKLELDIINSGGPSIIELMDNSEKLLARSFIKGDGKLVFSLLDKGTYRIRAISDLNDDGKWTTGDFFTLRQPEPVTYFPKVLEIPEGWDANEKWDMKEKNFKPQRLRPQPKTQ